MYSVVLMAALTAAPATPGCHWRSHSCHGCYGCYGCSGCYGCYGCYGCGGCYGCYGCGGCYGCYGCYGAGCYGYGFPVYVQPPGAPVAPKAEPIPAPKDKKENGKAEGQARVIVDVPADAKLFIDDQLMKTASERRVFRTPRLDKDQTYYYILRAEVTRDGKVESRTQRVILKAGDEVRASFSEMTATTEATASTEGKK